MVKSRLIGILVLGLAAAALLFLLLHKSETDRIRARFESLAEQVSKNGAENPLTAAGTAKNIAERFTDPCRMDIPESPYGEFSGPFTRKKLRSHVLGARSRFERIHLDLYDMAVFIPEEETARVDLTAHLTGHAAGDRSGEPPLEVFQELSCELEKIEGDWYIGKVRTVAVLEK